MTARAPGRRQADWIPPALMAAVALAALALVGNPSTWLTLTVAIVLGWLVRSPEDDCHSRT